MALKLWNCCQGGNMAEELLINQLFAGRYLDEGENIGHEVINLFKDDEGNNNLFITEHCTSAECLKCRKRRIYYESGCYSREPFNLILF